MTYHSVDPAAVAAVRELAKAVNNLARALEPAQEPEKPKPKCTAVNPRTLWECTLGTGAHQIINGRVQHKTNIQGETYDWFVEDWWKNER